MQPSHYNRTAYILTDILKLLTAIWEMLAFICVNVNPHCSLLITGQQMIACYSVITHTFK